MGHFYRLKFTLYPSRINKEKSVYETLFLTLCLILWHINICCSLLSLPREKRESLFLFVFLFTSLLFIKSSDSYFWSSLGVYVPKEYSNSTIYSLHCKPELFNISSWLCLMLTTYLGVICNSTCCCIHI